MAAILNVLKRFLEHRYLPAVLAMGAILVMLPALKTGLGLDDLVQRAVELKPSQLPPRRYETGLPSESSELYTVLCDLFGLRNECSEKAGRFLKLNPVTRTQSVNNEPRPLTPCMTCANPFPCFEPML